MSEVDTSREAVERIDRALNTPTSALREIRELKAERDELRQALEQARDVKPMVKKLEWRRDDPTGEGKFGNGLFNYQIRVRAPGCWWWSRFDSGIWYTNVDDTCTEDEAKAAAQADYERRILSALQSTTTKEEE